MTISQRVRDWVRARAEFVCEYCHSLEEASTARFALDHIHPRSLGGSDDPSNLALACQRCNSYRYNFTMGIDSETQKGVSLFNPRQQLWRDHFQWTADGLRIRGITATGRATCQRLDLNDDDHNDGFVVKARRLWVKGGWHPPIGDPRQSE